MKRPLVLLALLVATAAVAQEPEVRVSVDRPRPAAGETVRLTYTFSGSVSSDIKQPSSIPMKNLQVLGAPSISQQITMINFQMSRSISYTYWVKVMSPGPAEVGETTWTVGDRTIKAASYVLEAGPFRAGPPGTGDEPDERYPFFLRRYVNPNTAQRREAIIKYMVTADRTSAYVGEEIALHYELITQADVAGLEWVDVPKFPGLWAEDIERPERPVGHREMNYEGHNVVTRFTLLKKAVSGLTPGSVVVPPAKIRLQVRLGGMDPFSIFDPTPQVVERATEPLTLKILPIPGSPDFKGPVGKFDISAKVDRTSVAVGDAVTLKVRVAGMGNLRTATDPPKVEIPNVRLYPPTVKNDTARSSSKTSISAEWDFVLVPQTKGALTIPPIALEVFDPAEKRVVTKRTAPLTLAVQAGATLPTPAAAVAAAASSASTGSVPAGGSAAIEERPVGLVAVSQPAPTPAPGSHLDLKNGTVSLPLWLLATIPGALLLGFGVVVAARTRIKTRNTYSEALRPEPDETKERAAARIDRALRDVLARRYHVADAPSSAALVEALAAAGVPGRVLADTKGLLSELDFLRFAPQLGEYGPAIQKARDDARRLFGRIG